MTAENAAGKQRGRPFPKGRSGNPAGKPKGARHPTTLMAEKLMEADVDTVVRAVLDAAKDGDMRAARIILDRVAPPRKSRPITITLPEVGTAADIGNAIGAVIAAVADGRITPDEGAAVANLIEARRKAIEITDIERRVAVLEEKRRTDE